MRWLWIPLFVITLLCSCSKKGADDLTGLRVLVEDAITDNRPKSLIKLLHMDGADEDLVKMWEGMISGVDFSGFTKIDVQSHAFDEFEPDVDLPGEYFGRKLKWLVEPTHWIDAKLSNKDADGNGMGFNFTFAAGQVDGRWCLIGATYGEPAREPISLPGLTDVNATAISYDEDGEILDFVQIEPGSGIQEIVFQAPEDGSYIHVTVVGPARAPEIPLGVEVSTNNENAMRGSVSVNVEDDRVIGVFGNRIGHGYHMREEQLQKVMKMLQAGEGPSDRVEIIRRNAYLDQLIEDESGNLVPSDLGEKEEAFLAEVIPLLRKGDAAKLATHEHKNADDPSGLDLHASFYESIAEQGVKYYRFMRFDPDHPDNESYMRGFSGEPFRYSLTPKWELEIFHHTQGEETSSSGMLVGEEDGVLKFPTRYAH